MTRFRLILAAFCILPPLQAQEAITPQPGTGSLVQEPPTGALGSLSQRPRRFPGRRRRASTRPLFAGALADSAADTRLSVLQFDREAYDEAPNLFGDSLTGLTVTADLGIDTATADIPLAGGSRRVKVAENNKALPVDRGIFAYNYFHNARTVQRGPPFASRDLPVHRYIIGFERRLINEDWSVEFRMPFTNDPDLVEFDLLASPVLTVDGGQVGNLAVTVKHVFYADDLIVASSGLGVVAPTGSDVFMDIAFTDFRVHNQAVHLLPFVGFMAVPDADTFFHGFAQLDIATNGNKVEQESIFIPGLLETIGYVNEQNLLHLDLSAGHWLYRDDASLLTGAAAVAEVHYTTSLQDADAVISPTIVPPPRFGNARNQIDAVNLTCGLHLAFGDTTVHVGGVFPLRSDDNRFFDGEVLLAVNRRF